jgi:hypothetical protein
METLFISEDKPALTLEDIQDIVSEMADALEEFAERAAKINAQPIYGRDARNVGCADGTCARPDEDDWENAYRRACEAVDEAVEAGLLKERPYSLRRYSLYY